MAMPQRDNVIRRRSASFGGQVEEIKRLDMLLEQHKAILGDAAKDLAIK
jgi:hypothetical protein